jgi:Fe-S oxidoreductase
MCPTYRAAEEEITSTRGRANALREAMSGNLDPDEAFTDEFKTEVLDLCIGCKGCKIDCPSGVDMAKLKAEVAHEHHERHGPSLRDRLFVNFDTAAKLGSMFAPLANTASALPGSRWLLEQTLGIEPNRPLPEFHRKTFRDRFESRGGEEGSIARAATAADGDEPVRRAALYPDTITNYCNPNAGIAALETLESAGVAVMVPDGVSDTGRPAFSKGFLDTAKGTARDNLDVLGPLVEAGYDIVVIEPSDAVMFQSDYLDLHGGDVAESVAENAYGVCEYIDTFGLDRGLSFEADVESLAYHGHCHQKATAKDHHAVGVLRRAGYDIDPLDSGCCGMAGSFGYETEHGSMSDAIANILYGQLDDSDAPRVVAPGASCRTQLHNREGIEEEPPTPIELVHEAVAGPSR